MDKTAMVKMLAGTITRGVMWVLAYTAAKLGIETASQTAADAIGYFIASALVATAAMIWSWYKNHKLLAAQPADSGKTTDSAQS